MEFVDYDYTAAAHLGIGQPKIDDVGQQIVITWALPKKMARTLPLVMHLHVYYGNGIVEKFSYELWQLSSYKVFSLTGEAYHQAQGVVSYKVSLLHNGRELCNRKHHLWTEIIPLQ